MYDVLKISQQNNKKFEYSDLYCKLCKEISNSIQNISSFKARVIRKALNLMSEESYDFNNFILLASEYSETLKPLQTKVIQFFLTAMCKYPKYQTQYVQCIVKFIVNPLKNFILQVILLHQNASNIHIFGYSDKSTIVMKKMYKELYERFLFISREVCVNIDFCKKYFPNYFFIDEYINTFINNVEEIKIQLKTNKITSTFTQIHLFIFIAMRMCEPFVIQLFYSINTITNKLTSNEKLNYHELLQEFLPSVLDCFSISDWFSNEVYVNKLTFKTMDVDSSFSWIYNFVDIFNVIDTNHLSTKELFLNSINSMNKVLNLPDSMIVMSGYTFCIFIDSLNKGIMDSDYNEVTQFLDKLSPRYLHSPILSNMFNIGQLRSYITKSKMWTEKQKLDFNDEVMRCNNSDLFYKSETISYFNYAALIYLTILVRNINETNVIFCVDQFISITRYYAYVIHTDAIPLLCNYMLNGSFASADIIMSVIFYIADAVSLKSFNDNKLMAELKEKCTVIFKELIISHNSISHIINQYFCCTFSKYYSINQQDNIDIMQIKRIICDVGHDLFDDFVSFFPELILNKQYCDFYQDSYISELYDMLLTLNGFETVEYWTLYLRQLGKCLLDGVTCEDFSLCLVYSMLCVKTDSDNQKYYSKTLPKLLREVSQRMVGNIIACDEFINFKSIVSHIQNPLLLVCDKSDYPVIYAIIYIMDLALHTNQLKQTKESLQHVKLCYEKQQQDNNLIVNIITNTITSLIDVSTLPPTIIKTLGLILERIQLYPSQICDNFITIFKQFTRDQKRLFSSLLLSQRLTEWNYCDVYEKNLIIPIYKEYIRLVEYTITNIEIYFALHQQTNKNTTTYTIDIKLTISEEVMKIIPTTIKEMIEEFSRQIPQRKTKELIEITNKLTTYITNWVDTILFNNTNNNTLLYSLHVIGALVNILIIVIHLTQDIHLSLDSNQLLDSIHYMLDIISILAQKKLS
ncbi:hypothetical protein QTN25_005781 [Entamoeba marina]